MSRKQKLRAKKGQTNQKPKQGKKVEISTKPASSSWPRIAPAYKSDVIQPKWDSSEWWVCEADTFSGLCGQVNPPWVENCEYCRAPRGLVDRRKHVVERPPVVSEHYFEPNQVVKSANVVRVERVSLASKVFSGILRLIGFSP